MKARPTTLFAVLSTIVMFAAVLTGLIVIGSPSESRMRRLDQRRADNLESISRAIARYRDEHESLPQKLEALGQSQPYTINYSLKDPMGLPYEYMVKDPFTYELCAVFDLAADMSQTDRYYSVFEKHGAGRQCFSQEARPPVKH
jgi:hypothetical protein